MIFYWLNDCIKGNLELPYPVFNISCGLTCPDDHYIGYEKGIAECLKCPPDTYKNGIFFHLKEQYKEQTRLNLKNFQKNCYVLSDTTEINDLTKIRNVNCSGWIADNINNWIQTANNSNLINMTVYNELVYGVELYRDGFVL